MKIDTERLVSAATLAEATLVNQDIPKFLKKRWQNALEKAVKRLIEQPYFSWQPDRLIIVSVPPERTNEYGCRFYEATETECRRVDRDGLCQAFFEGFPCWHRGAFLLLGIYLGEMQNEVNKKPEMAAATVN